MTELYTAWIKLDGFNAETKMYFRTVEERKSFCAHNTGARSGKKPERAHRDEAEITQMNIRFYGLAA